MTSAEVAAPVYLDDDEPEFLRLSPARRVAAVVPLTLPYAWGAVSPWPVSWDRALLFLFVLVAALKVYRSSERLGLELHRGYLVLRRGWFSKAAAACDIEDIRIERRGRWSSRRLTIVLTNGKRHRAYEAGRSGGLLRTNFEHDLQRVRDWWSANGDLDVVVVHVNRTPEAA